MKRDTVELKTPVRVMIVDDEPSMREALSMLLGFYSDDITVVGTASDGAEGVARVGILEPDVILMDVRMPNLDGISAARQIVRDHPLVQIVMLSAYPDQALIDEARAAGAASFQLKGAAPQEVLQSVRSAAALGRGGASLRAV